MFLLFNDAQLDDVGLTLKILPSATASTGLEGDQGGRAKASGSGEHERCDSC